MGQLSDEVKNFVQNARGLDNARMAADEWYKTVGKSSGDKSIQSTSGPFQPGKIYIFRYEHPVTMERLEQWDANPVVLSLGRVDGNDVGINLNYLPQKVKLQAVSDLVEVPSDEEFLTILEGMESLKTKEEIREYWVKHEKILDLVIPGSTTTTLRELLLGMVKQLND